MKVCYICSSAEHIDDHHIDCRFGEVSPDTVPLCRRCHRTYHDLGVEWFDDELLDKAIEVENMRRRIFNEAPLKKSDIVRSDYWYKKHGIKRERRYDRMVVGPEGSLIRPGLDPLCGWAWLEENKGKRYPEQTITIFYDDKVLLSNPTKRGLIRTAMTMTRNVTMAKAHQSL